MCYFVHQFWLHSVKYSWIPILALGKIQIEMRCSRQQYFLQKTYLLDFCPLLSIIRIFLLSINYDIHLYAEDAICPICSFNILNILVKQYTFQTNCAFNWSDEYFNQRTNSKEVTLQVYKSENKFTENCHWWNDWEDSGRWFLCIQINTSFEFFLKKSYLWQMSGKGCHTHSNIYNCIYLWQILTSENTSEFGDFRLDKYYNRWECFKVSFLCTSTKKLPFCFPIFSFVVIYWIHIQSEYRSVGWFVVVCHGNRKHTHTHSPTVKWWMICGLNRTHCPIHIESLSSVLKFLIHSNFSEASSVLMGFQPSNWKLFQLNELNFHFENNFLAVREESCTKLQILTANQAKVWKKGSKNHPQQHQQQQSISIWI